MKSNAQRLSDFHAAIGSVSPHTPTVPDRELLLMRRRLITEEWQELEAEFDLLLAQQVTDPKKLSALAHEMADLLYVVYGTFDQLGIDADAVFSEIHRANLSKAGGPRRADGKILKPEGWQAPDIARVIEEQMQ